MSRLLVLVIGMFFFWLMIDFVSKVAAGLTRATHVQLVVSASTLESDGILPGRSTVGGC